MAKPELGTKRLCSGCGAKFYDLSKDPILCPKCGTAFVIVAPVSRRADAIAAAAAAATAAAAAAASARAKEAEAEVPETPDAEFVSLEDADAEAQGKKGDAARPGTTISRSRRPKRRPSSKSRKKATTTSPTSSAKAARTRRRPKAGPGCSIGTIRKPIRGHSSAGRALAWHARGRRFDPAWLHQFSRSENCPPKPVGRRRAQIGKPPPGRLSLFMATRT